MALNCNEVCFAFSVQISLHNRDVQFDPLLLKCPVCVVYNVVSIPAPDPDALFDSPGGHIFFAEIAFFAGLVGGLAGGEGWEFPVSVGRVACGWGFTNLLVRDFLFGFTACREKKLG